MNIGTTQPDLTVGTVAVPQNVPRYIERCPYGTVMTGLFGRAGAGVDRLGGVCEEYDDLGSFVDFSAGSQSRAVVVPARGGNGGTAWAGERCQAGAALVGIDIRFGDLVDQVRGVCADLSQWTSVDNAPTTLLATHGPNTGTRVNHRCISGYVLDGWTVMSSARINWMDIHCVRAED